MQFLFTIFLVGLLVLLARHQSDEPTAPNTFVVGSGIDAAIKSNPVKHVGVNVSGSGRGSSCFGSSGESFDRPSQNESEATLRPLAAEKDRMQMEDLAKAGKFREVRSNLHCKTYLTQTADKA